MSAPAGAALRAAAARAVHRVASDGRRLDTALAPELEAFDARDQALLKALVHATVRGYPRVARIVDELLARPMRPRDRILSSLAAVGIAQLDALRIPEHAAVHATVDACTALGRPRARGLVNALLRRYQRERHAIHARLADDVAFATAHPRWLAAAFEADWPERWRDICEAGNVEPPLWLRVNRQVQGREAYAARLAAAGLTAHAHPEAPDALCVEPAVPVSALPGFDDGAVSVQDAAAQLAVEWLAPAPGQRILDACAAPGGKTAHLLEREPALAEVVAVDVDARRVSELGRGLERLNLRATLLTADATRPADWAGGRRFDRILLDAPCSATGVIRRHPDVKLLRRERDLPALARLQGQLLDALWPLLAPGGRLVFATCSVLRADSEAPLAAFLQRRPDARPVPPGVAIPSAQRRIFPGEANMDGFYYACLQHVD